MLRAATLADLDTVAWWIASVHDCELWAGWRVSFPIDRAALPEAIEFARTAAFALDDDDEIVAFGQIVTKPAGRAHLARLIVNPRLRSRSHGEHLVRALIEQARGGPFDRVSLNVQGANSPAVSLYIKLGFVGVARPPDEPEVGGVRYMEQVAVRGVRL